MSIRKNTNSLKDKIQNNEMLKLIILIASFILPIIFILNATGIINNDVLNFYSFLWIGFYSSIFSLLFIDKKMINIILIIINIAIIIFALIGSLLAGVNGLLFMTIKMIFPFIPAKWIGIELRP